MNTEQARFNMIEQQIRPWEVLDPHVLDCCRSSSAKTSCRRPPALAFVDMEIPLRRGGQCMLAPKVEARLLQDCSRAAAREGAGNRRRLGLHGRPAGHRAQRVISAGDRPRAGPLARANLQRAGMLNARCARPTAPGPPGDGPFDVILLSGSVAEVPQPCWTSSRSAAGWRHRRAMSR
jgi:protein-L-isoaspartate(D-aspartate) O-methyltransferase